MAAIERPKGEQDPKVGPPIEKSPALPPEPQGGILKGSEIPTEDLRGESQPVPDEKVAFLGVGGIEADEALKHQLELKNGLLLTQIDPNSPAGLAGLAEYDVIESVDGTPLTDQDSLRHVLSKHAPGDEVNLKIIRRGENIEQKIALGESQTVPNIQGLIPEQTRDLNRLLRDRIGQQLGGFDNEQLRRQLLEEMERAFGPDGGKDILEFKLDLNGGNLFDGAEKKLGLHGTGSMRLQDNEGFIELKMSNGSQELTIRDLDGNTLFTGPYDSDIDKEAVPEMYRERVRGLVGNDGKTEFRLKMGNLRHLRTGGKGKRRE